MWVQVSPWPALQVQWAQQTSPVSSRIIQQDKGGSFNHWE